MAGTLTVTGVLTDGTTVRLDNPLPYVEGDKICVTIEIVTHKSKEATVDAFLTELRSMQAARSNIPQMADQIEERIRIERHSWGD